MPTLLAQSNHSSDTLNASRLVRFRARDRYSISDPRPALRIPSGQSVDIHLRVDKTPPSGIVELRFTAMPEVLESQHYARKHLNAIVELSLNGVPIHDDGV